MNSKYYILLLFLLLATIPPLIQSDNSSPNNYKSIARASLFDKLSTYISKKRKQLFDEDTLIANTIPDIAPGEFCNTDSACSGYPLSYCEDTCKCREGTFNAGTTCITSNPVPLSIKGNCATNEVYSEEGGLCLSKQSPGQPCQYSEQCSITISGAFCLNRKCACPLGWVASADGNTCNFKDTQCQAKGFIWVEELGECKEVILPGSGTCSHSLQCSAAFGGAVCFQKVCKCPTLTPVPTDGTCGITCTTGGESFSSIVGSCLPNVEPGNECVYTSQCHAPHPGTICSMGRCKCARSQVFTGTMCADVCPSGFRIGNFNVCQASCNANQIEHNGNCLDFAAPGQNCEVNAQCTSSSLCATWNDAGISGSRCTCPSNMKIDSGICVIIKAQPGASCLLGEMCTGGSYCTSGICTCNTGTVQVNSQCITPISVGPGSSCLSNAVKCGNGSECTSGTCQCNGESHLVNGRCVKQSFALPGESCAMGQECSRQSVCSHQTQRCECILATKIAIGRTCVDRLRSHPGFPCGGGEVCVGGSQCHKSTCKCPGNQIAIDKQCTEAKRLLPGSNCKEEDICTGGSECSNQGKCECRQNQVIVQSMCTRIILSKPTEKCNGPQYRCIQNSYCQDGESCVCLAGMKLYHGQCKAVSRKSPGLGCSEFDECTNHSYCSGGFCHCTAPRILKNGRCEFAVQVSAGNQCRADDICLGGSNCLGGRCLCNEKTEVVRGGVCVEKIYKTPGQMCSESEICDGNSYCGRSKICVCYKNFIVQSGKCVKKSRSNPGESCANGERCDGSSYCFKDMCICPRNHIKRDFTCIPLQEVKIGESCSNGQSCLAGSKCSPISKICACPPGFVNRHDLCVPIEVNPGLPCQHGETCLGRSSCKAGICTCPPSLPQIIDFVCSEPETVRRIVQPTPSYTQQRRAQNNGHSSHNQQSRVDHTRESVSNHDQRKAETKQEPPPSYNQQKSTPQNNQPYNNDINEAFVLQTVPDALSDCPLDGSCALPDCFCSRTGKEVPGRIPPANTPQMVILTFDGPVNDRVTNIYKSILSGKHVNPNGCPIKATFFVSHEWSNYDQIEWLHSAGHEIAINSITHRTLTHSNEVEWKQEMDGMRAALEKFSFIDKRKVIGIRAPQLAMGGNAQFGMMAANSFLYDNTQGTVGGPFWPQSLKFKTPWPCIGQSCPNTSHEVWEFPLDMIVGSDGRPNVLIRQAVTRYDSPQKVADMVMANFNRSALSNRAPFILNIDADFLNQIPYEGGSKAIDLFIEKVLELNEVFFVTMEQALNWIQQPTPLNKLRNFRGWQCQFGGNGGGLPCENPSTCTYSPDNRIKAPHSFRVCGTCPRIYPWIDDPTGKGL